MKIMWIMTVLAILKIAAFLLHLVQQIHCMPIHTYIC